MSFKPYKYLNCTPQELLEIRGTYYLPFTKSYKRGTNEEVLVELKPKRIKDLTNQELESILFKVNNGFIKQDTENYSIDQLRSWLITEIKYRNLLELELMRHFLNSLFPKGKNKWNKAVFDALLKPVAPKIYYVSQVSKFDTTNIGTERPLEISA